MFTGVQAIASKDEWTSNREVKRSRCEPEMSCGIYPPACALNSGKNECMTWLLDMDGVIWRRNEPITGSVEAIAQLYQRGIEVVFVTNNSSAEPAGYVAKLGGFGVHTDVDHIVTAAQATARQLQPGWSVLTIAGPGMIEALRERGCRVYEPQDCDPASLGNVDAVIVANRPEAITTNDLSLAMQAVLQGAKYFVPNEDPLYPIETGFGLGTGAVGACITYATGVHPRYAGKPNQEMADLVRERYPDITLMVGDQLATDGQFAVTLGVPYAHVHTGISVSGRIDASSSKPPIAHDAADLATLVREWH